MSYTASSVNLLTADRNIKSFTVQPYGVGGFTFDIV